ncbi:hypothetical protein [Peribacillus cavernae]|uniref:hypothetical protein n=1 Tax=Peribacillus cavernae TaxID=1674310 RepID=UPI00163BA8F4|nr:hypothetical protein [Peribacillus cavernae]MDQ0219334.1 uncharacterized protein YraI [Peribacillus cavernae]
MDINGRSVNGWCRIHYIGKPGYVSSRYMNASKSIAPSKKKSVQVVSNPESTTVIVNKQNKLPDGYIAKDLVYASIPFISNEKTEKSIWKRSDYGLSV